MPLNLKVMLQKEGATLFIRPFCESDAHSMLTIYKPYVENSAISFEHDVPSIAEFTERVLKYVSCWAGSVAETDGRVLGYAYGSEHRSRAAYKWSVETTVYVQAEAQGHGVGRQLYAALLPELCSDGFCNAYASVTLPNPASLGLHQALGFKPIGSFNRVGRKFGQWHDVAWFHLPLRDEPPA